MKARIAGLTALLVVASLVAVGAAYAMPATSVTNSDNSVETRFVTLTLGDDSDYTSYINNFDATLHYRARTSVRDTVTTTYIVTDDTEEVLGVECVSIGKVVVTVESTDTIDSYRLHVAVGNEEAVSSGFAIYARTTSGDTTGEGSPSDSINEGILYRITSEDSTTVKQYNANVYDVNAKSSTVTVELFVVADELTDEPPMMILDGVTFVFSAEVRGRRDRASARRRPSRAPSGRGNRCLFWKYAWL